MTPIINKSSDQPGANLGLSAIYKAFFRDFKEASDEDFRKPTAWFRKV